MNICFWKRKIDPFEIGLSSRYQPYLTLPTLLILNVYVKIQLNEYDDIKPKV